MSYASKTITNLIKTTSLLTDDRVDPAAKDNFPIINACRDGKLELVTILLADRRVDPSFGVNVLIDAADDNGLM